MFGLTVVTAPAAEPLSYAEAKAQLRFSHDYELALIESLIKAARVYCETVTGRAFITQTLRLTTDAFPAYDGEFRLPRPPLLTVTNIQYTDSAGATQTVDSSTYVVDATSLPGRIALAYGETWPTDALEQIGVVKVNYTAGYGATAASVPETIKHAMRLLIGHWFVNREAVVTGTITKDIEFAVAALLGSEWSGTMAGTFN